MESEKRSEWCRATVHGFRSLASTVLNEAKFNRDWIEMQPAHADSSVRGVYNAAEWLSVRRTMFQWWADYVEAQRVEGQRALMWLGTDSSFAAVLRMRYRHGTY